ncbi:MAG: aspartate dehydrogenase [Methanobacteriota archaeon]
MNVTILGCGAIGGTLAKALQGMDGISGVVLYDIHSDKSEALQATLPKAKRAASLDEAIAGGDLIVEAANQDAVIEFLPKALAARKDVLVLSVGALLNYDFRATCKDLATKNGRKIYIPSGAVAGIDGLGAAGEEQIDEVILMSYKPPAALEGAEYFKKRGIDLTKIDGPKVVFDGSAREAVKLFPKNINVAATISLAGLGFEKTRVKLVVDPKATKNTHRLIVKWKFGEIEAWTRNEPFPSNPRTSYLAALSAISAVKKIAGTVWVGV